MIIKILQFIAEILDADFEVCDDGFVICIKNGKTHFDLTFDEAGNFEEVLVKK